MAAKKRPARRQRKPARTSAKAASRRAAPRRSRTSKRTKPTRARAKLRPRLRARPVAKRQIRRKPAKAAKITRPSKVRAATRKKPQARPRPKLRKAPAPSKAPPSALGRTRRVLAEAERLGGPAMSGGLPDSRLVSSARTGHAELVEELREHTEASPAFTAGDVDARWQDAYAIGDEAPGGDNMTPDQDRVEDIGKALGVTYQDDQPLGGGEEIADRDRRRWELDPASSDDWPHGKD